MPRRSYVMTGYAIACEGKHYHGMVPVTEGERLDMLITTYPKDSPVDTTWRHSTA